MPWEIGLAEVQQTLRVNGLRGRVRLRVDGGFKTGHDVMLAALLGADEYAFGTAALFAEGCIMARACHRDTCPVGVATQRLDLREKFAGTPDSVAAYLVMVAEEVRELLAAAGFRTLDEAIGRVDALVRGPTSRASRPASTSCAARRPGVGERRFVAREPIQDPRSELGDRVAEDALETVFLGGISEFAYPIAPSDRSVGARLGGAVGLEFGELDPPGLARLRFTGAAGQSFGAFVTRGVELVLEGEANDYVGKGLGGGRIVIRPPADDAGEPVLLGNTALYGATAGELFVAGRAGERFAVRNSGATAVVEGVGDHACEYMTGGTVVVLGPTGANIGAGMSGGAASSSTSTAACSPASTGSSSRLAARQRSELSEVAELLREHVAVTGSVLGRRLLDDWEATGRLLWRIAPASEGERASAGGRCRARRTTERDAVTLRPETGTPAQARVVDEVLAWGGERPTRARPRRAAPRAPHGRGRGVARAACARSDLAARPLLVTKTRLSRLVCDGLQRDPEPYVHAWANVRGTLVHAAIEADVDGARASRRERSSSGRGTGSRRSGPVTPPRSPRG
jgi:glutamate synthase domain-containing protein 3